MKAPPIKPGSGKKAGKGAAGKGAGRGEKTGKLAGKGEKPEKDVRQARIKYHSVVSGKLKRGPHNPLERGELAYLLGRGAWIHDPKEGILELMGEDEEALYARTTLDVALQKNVLKWVKNAGALNVALVVLDPESGKILALAGNNSQKSRELPYNPALSGHVPAASVFKIVTAAAAMERNKYTRESIVLYDGGKHTLYQGNVVREPDRGVHKASLEEGFAQSVNAVFGKLGIYTMLPEELVAFSERMGFNKAIPFDLPMGPSTFSLSDPEDPFLLAELSSGFNRTTTISPLHAALIAASVLKGGVMPAPRLVTEARDASGNKLYSGKEGTLGRVMSKETGA